jgi:K+-sensing histidine kinase KdpD
MDWQKLQDRPALEQYGLTLFLVICALAIRLAMYAVIADRAPYMFFFLVVAAVSRLWGPGPGVFATLLGGLATWYFLLEPQFSFTFSQQHDVITLISYFAVAIAISFLPQASSRGQPSGGRAK